MRHRVGRASVKMEDGWTLGDGSTDSRLPLVTEGGTNGSPRVSAGNTLPEADFAERYQV